MPTPSTPAGQSLANRAALQRSFNSPPASTSGSARAAARDTVRGLNKLGGYTPSSPFSARPSLSPRPLQHTPQGRRAINAANGLMKRAAGATPLRQLGAGARGVLGHPMTAKAAKFASSPAGGGLLAAGGTLAARSGDGLSQNDVAAAALVGGATALGAMAGPVASFLLGTAAGYLADRLFPAHTGFRGGHTGGEQPLHTGGQMSGVVYRITGDREYPPCYNKEGGDSFEFYANGPVNLTTERYDFGGSIVDIYPDCRDESANVLYLNGGYKGYAGQHSNIQVVPRDGSPDTGGNPPLVPVSVPPAAPARSNPGQTAPSQAPSPLSFPAAIPAGALAAAGIAAGGVAANPATLNGPGIQGAPRSGKRPQAKPRSTPKPAGNTASGAGARPPQQPPTRTKQNTRCGCNKGILDGVKQMFNNHADTAAQLGLLATILDLLSTVKGLVNNVVSAVGVDAFPMSAPVNLNKKASGTTTLNNLAEAHVWQAQNLDSTIGGWPNTIQNLDSGADIENLTVSDSLAEIQGLLMAMAIGQGINQQGIFKTLTETTGIKQQTMLARQYAQGNAEYLGYNLRQTSRQVPNTYTPGVENIMELLTPGKIPMESVENADEMDLQTCLRELCASAAIIRAVFFRNTGTQDIEAALRERLEQANAVNAKGSDFDEYLRQVEQGFGLSQPYGRDPSNGPRISDRTSTNNDTTP